MPQIPHKIQLASLVYVSAVHIICHCSQNDYFSLILIQLALSQTCASRDVCVKRIQARFLIRVTMCCKYVLQVFIRVTAAKREAGSVIYFTLSPHLHHIALSLPLPEGKVPCDVLQALSGLSYWRRESVFSSS